MPKRNIRLTGNDMVFTIVNYAFLTVCLLLVLYPLVYIVSSSFSSSEAVISARVWLFPVEPTLLGYEAVFKNPQILSGYMNSAIYAVFGTIISVTLTVMAGYPLSKKDFYGRNVIIAVFTFTMLFSGGLIPYYLVIKNLNLIDTRWALLLPNAIAVWNVIIARTYFQNTIPVELGEAAELDGCSDFSFILRVVVPLSGPIIAVMVLFYAVGQWNSYFDAMILLKNNKLFPLQIILRNILIQNQFDANMLVDVSTLLRKQGMRDLLKYSLIVVASAPVLALYPFVQRYFIKGIMVGAIKG
jgi:putative aldouronate transport system permease protein